MSGAARILGALGLRLPVFGIARAGAVPAAGAEPSAAKSLREDGTWSSSGGGGSGDVVGPSSSVASEVALFDGTTGKLIKRASATGIAKLTSGVLSAATAGTDYYAPGSTDVAVADGGTGSSTAAGARTNLGLGTAAVLDAATTRASGGIVKLGTNLLYGIDELVGHLGYHIAYTRAAAGSNDNSGWGNPSISGSGGSQSNGRWLRSTSATSSGWIQGTRLADTAEGFVVAVAFKFPTTIGTAFAAPVADAPYLAVFTGAAGGSVVVELIRLDTGTRETATISATLPAAATKIDIVVYTWNQAVSKALEFSYMYRFLPML